MSSKVNQLKFEKSPYLLQHQNNPVAWYTWNEKAFEAARTEDKPIFLSIGYSTCHWCHVMAHECFENEAVAKILNEHFIPIKLDREERPDVDEIYMSALHALGQRGGWPLSMFLSPNLKPFFGGTYWPQPHFIRVLEHIAKAWVAQRGDLEKSGEDLLHHLSEQKVGAMGIENIKPSLLQDFAQNSWADFDRVWGGFGSAPKFPHATQLSMLLRIGHQTEHPEAIQMVIHTLEKMAQGGLYDHLGGGFSRYSTDARWMIPHFEKMLYDNALLVTTYLEAFQETKIAMFEQVAKETLDYILRQMTDPEGGFYSAEDADSEGHEGKFYVWSYRELKNRLSSSELEYLAKVYQVTEEGNFEGANHFHLNPEFAWDEKYQADLKSIHEKLFKIREARIHPHLDDKILTSWNGLMIRAMALGFQVSRDSRYLEAAHRSAAFIKKELFKDGKLLARYRDGEAAFSARLEDYAYLIQGLIELYACDFNPEVLKWALELQEMQNKIFEDQESGGYFSTDGQDASLLIRKKEGMDGALPNANGVAALNLLKLEAYSEDVVYREKSKGVFQSFASLMNQYPHAFSQLLIAYDYYLQSGQQLGIVEKNKDAAIEEHLEKLQQSFHPYLLVAKASEGESFPAFLKDRRLLDGQTTYYLCQSQSCEKPTTQFSEITDSLTS